MDSTGYEVLNKWAQLFVDTVRSTGAENAERNLIVNTYSANSGITAVSNFKIQEDSVGN